MNLIAPPEVTEFEDATTEDSIGEFIAKPIGKPSPPIFPVVVKDYARKALLQSYPALESSEHAWQYLRLVEYLLFSTFRDTQGHIVLPHQLVAERVGRSTGSKGFSADDWINRFSADVFPLNVKSYNRFAGLARTVSPDWAQPVQDFLAMTPLALGEDGMVYLVSGEPVTRSRQKRIASDLEERLLEQAKNSSKVPDVARLINYLNTKSASVQKKCIRQNMPRVLAMLDAMPTMTEHERYQKDYVAAALSSLHSFNRNIYEGKPRTARIYTIGPSFHSLPRDFRKALLDGCIFLDAKSVQLAIVAKLWDMPKLQEFLAYPYSPSIWQALHDHVQPNMCFADSKIVFKRAIYSLVFGMKEPGLRWYLLWGDKNERIRGLQDKQAVERFMTHPLVQEALAQREIRLNKIKQQGFVEDKFGQRREYIPGQSNERSLLATEVQSWEMYLMLSLLDTFEKEEDLHLVSFLHDGIAIRISDRAKTDRFIDKLKSIFASAASRAGIRTSLIEER